jgi:hypothetical protein
MLFCSFQLKLGGASRRRVVTDFIEGKEQKRPTEIRIGLLPNTNVERDRYTSLHGVINVV